MPVASETEPTAGATAEAPVLAPLAESAPAVYRLRAADIFALLAEAEALALAA